MIIEIFNLSKIYVKLYKSVFRNDSINDLIKKITIN